jgi:hypothetical protein
MVLHPLFRKQIFIMGNHYLTSWRNMFSRTSCHFTFFTLNLFFFNVKILLLIDSMHWVNLINCSACIVFYNFTFVVIVQWPSFVQFLVPVIFLFLRWWHSLVGIYDSVEHCNALIPTGIKNFFVLLNIKVGEWLSDFIESSKNSCCLKFILASTYRLRTLLIPRFVHKFL